MYRIVSSVFFDLKRCQEHLEKQINTLILENWTPQGGISLIKTSGGLYIMHQAMIKKS